MRQSFALLIPLALIALGGCSLMPGKERTPEGKVSINWHCQPKGEGGQQLCQQRRMRNGKPVDDEIFDTMVIPADVPIEAMAASPHRPPASAGSAVPWRRQPLSRVNALGEDTGLQVENLGPAPRKVRNTADVWKKPEAATIAAADAAPGREPGKPAAANGKRAAFDGYTLQLAAFSAEARCGAFIAQYQSKLPIHKRNISSRQADWCIVTHGDFSTLSEARAASRVVAEKHPGLSFWVRSWASIRELEVGPN